MLTAKGRRVRVEPTAGPPPSRDSAERALRERIAAEGRSPSKPIWKPATLIITRRAIRSERAATSPPRRRSARCSARWSGPALADAGCEPGAPDALYAELGPGPGTLAATGCACCARAALRARSIWSKPVRCCGSFRQALSRRAWHESSRISGRPLMLVANDSSMRSDPADRSTERSAALRSLAGGLAFDRDGEVIELSPAREAAVTAVAHSWRKRRRRVVHRLWPCAQRQGRHASGGPPSRLRAAARRSWRTGPDLACRFRGCPRAASDAGAAVTPLVGQGEWLPGSASTQGPRA